MTAFLSFEWLKLTKRWMPRVILAMIAGLMILAFWGMGSRGHEVPNLLLPRGWLLALLFTSFFAPFFWPVLGGSWAGNEYGWGTIRMILTRRPYRVQHVLAALLVLVGGLAIAMLVVLIVGTLAGIAASFFTHKDTFVSAAFDNAYPATLLKSFLAAWYVSAFFLTLGYGFAIIFRSAAVGIGVGIGSSLAEFILRGIFNGLGGAWQNIADHFPVVYTNDFVTQVARSGLAAGTDAASRSPGAPSAGQSMLAITIYLAALLIVTLAVVRTRDVTA
jgi:ABC-type transport system involved in multi-copper enzyme maturation permease subunit